MKHYHNKKETKKVGLQIRDLRKSKNLSIEDIAAMTGFAESTISKIENGSNTDTSHLIEIGKAIGVQPMEIFNIVFELKPRFKLPPNNAKRNNLKSRITKILAETIFFDKPKFVNEVEAHLLESEKLNSDPTSISVVLKRLVKEGKLQFKKVGRKNYYIKKK